jgi:tellurite resistance protein TerC
VELLHHFHWLILVFGGFLLYSGVMFLWPKRHKEHVFSIEQNKVYRVARKVFRFTPDLHGNRFFVRLPDGLRYATPLFLVLLIVESTDLIFAVDSIPAVLAVSSEFDIVYTSNIFAILGLRALYFALAGIMPLFRFLKQGLAVVLLFIGTKLVLQYFEVKIDTWVSLTVVASVLLVSVLLSRILPGSGEPIPNTLPNTLPEPEAVPEQV